MSNKSANAVVDRLLKVYAVKSDNQLSEILNVKRSTLGNWRARDSVPYSICVSTAEEKGISLDWLLTGSGAMHKGATPDTEPAANLAAEISPRERALLELFKGLTDDDQREICRDAEEKKRIHDMERQLKEMQANLESLKKSG